MTMQLPSCTTCGPSDDATRKAGCWWVTQVLGVGVNLGGRPVQGLGGFGLGSPTYDPTLLAAATAITNLNDPCNLTASGATVAAFQTAWNATIDGNMRQSTNSQNVVNWPLTVDGKYGPNTADAAQAALDQQSPSPCTSYTGSYGGGGGGGGGGYSATVIAAAQALDAYLAQNGCTACTQAGAPPSSGDPLSALVQTFKQAILVSPGNTSTASATVTGSTINMSSTACQQSFGPGSIADLTAVLGANKQSGSTACTDSNCNCLSGSGQPPGPSPTPPPLPAPPGPSPIPTPPSTPASSHTALVAGVVAAGAAAAAGLYVYKRRHKGGHRHPGL